MTNKTNLAVNTILLFLSKAISSLSIIALFMVLSYLLAPSEYGGFRQVWLIGKASLEIFAIGIPMSIYYFLARIDDTEKRLFVLQSLTVMAFMGAVCATLTYLFSDFLAFAFNNDSVAALFRVFFLYPLFTIPVTAVECILVTLGKAQRFALFLLIDKLTMVIVSVITIYIFRTVESLLVVLVIFSFIEVVISLLLVRWALKGKASEPSTVSVSQQVKFALPSGMANIVDIVSVELDKFVISIYFNVEKFATYANGAFELPFIGTVANAATSVLMPEYTKNYEKQAYNQLLNLWHASIIRTAIIFLPFIVFLFVFAEDFITTMFSDKYAASSIIFQIYLIAHIPKLTWYGPVLVAMGFSREPLIGSVVALSSNIVLNLLLIQWIGFTGPAIATVITTYLVMFYYLHRLKQLNHTTWAKVYPWSQVAIMTVMTLVVCLGLHWVFTEWFSMHKILRLVLAYGIMMLVLILIFRRLRIINDEDVAFVKSYLIKFGLIKSSS